VDKKTGQAAAFTSMTFLVERPGLMDGGRIHVMKLPLEKAIILNSLCSRVYQHFKQLFEWKGNKNFFKRMQSVDSYYRTELERSLE
jgi:hypothetical protein